jgi:hypothetical protein
VALSERWKQDRAPDRIQEDLAKDASKSQCSLYPALRPSLHVRHPAKRSCVADKWVTQMLRQTDAQVFEKYSQMKLQMKREALAKLNRKANYSFDPFLGFGTGLETGSGRKNVDSKR